jgi:hypothetical protein
LVLAALGVDACTGVAVEGRLRFWAGVLVAAGAAAGEALGVLGFLLDFLADTGAEALGVAFGVLRADFRADLGVLGAVAVGVVV